MISTFELLSILLVHIVRIFMKGPIENANQNKQLGITI